MQLKRFKAAMVIILPVVMMLTILFSPTYAITGNSTSDSPPYVGVVVLFSDAARQQPIGYSTGILVSPTVVLTAGHSTLGVAAVSVCFDKGPISYSIKWKFGFTSLQRNPNSLSSIRL